MQFRIRNIGPLPSNRQAPRLRGLGDLVAVFAEPIKRAGIRHGPPAVRRMLEQCNCDENRERLNRAVPFG